MIGWSFYSKKANSQSFFNLYNLQYIKQLPLTRKTWENYVQQQGEHLWIYRVHAVIEEVH